MNEQTHKTAGTACSQKEEGRRMTTKSATARSSITDTHGKHKKVIDAEEEQRRKLLENDADRLEVDCRLFATTGIPNLLDETDTRHELAMIAETAAKTIRSILLRAADRAEYALNRFEEEKLEIHLWLHEPYRIKAIIKEEDHGKN